MTAYKSHCCRDHSVFYTSEKSAKLSQTEQNEYVALVIQVQMIIYEEVSGIAECRVLASPRYVRSAFVLWLKTVN